MSVSEAAARAILKLREDKSLAGLAQQEAETMVRVEELLQMKSEGRILNMDDNALIGRFVDRVERRGEADRKDEVDARMAELKAVKDAIDPRAYEMSIYDVPGIKEHILVILQENHLETFGDLIFTVRTNPDSILAFNGIGPKFYEEILETVDSYEFPQVEVEEVVEVALPAEEETIAEVELPEVETTPEIVEIESIEETVEEEIVEEPEPVVEEPEPVVVADEGTEEKSFEELFRLDSLRRDKTTTDDEDELNAMDPSKKKKGKKRRGYTVEYDPDQDTDVVRYTHRKGEDDWENW